MTRLEIRRWNGQIARPGMLAVIRRKIEAMQAHGTVLVDCEGSTATAEQVAVLMSGFPPHKVKFCGSSAALPHPLPGNVSVANEPRTTRIPRAKRGITDTEEAK